MEGGGAGPAASERERLLQRIAAARERNKRLVAELDDTLSSKRRLALDIEQRAKEAQDLRLLRVRLQQNAETEEEFITNSLLKKLDQLKKEKEQLAQLAEREEEFIANNLRRRLQKLRQDKIDCENRLEQEQEYIVNTLQKQLLRLSQRKNELQRTLLSSRGALLQALGEQVSEARGTLSDPAPPAAAPCAGDEGPLATPHLECPAPPPPAAAAAATGADAVSAASSTPPPPASAPLGTPPTPVVRQTGTAAAPPPRPAEQRLRLLDLLQGEIQRLQRENAERESTVRAYHRQSERLHAVLERLRTENAMRDREHRSLRRQLEKVSAERKELFLAAEQLLEKKINEQLRKAHPRRRGGCSDVSDVESQGSRRSSSLCSSALGTPQVASVVHHRHRRAEGVPSARSHSLASTGSLPSRLDRQLSHDLCSGFPPRRIGSAHAKRSSSVPQGPHCAAAPHVDPQVMRAHTAQVLKESPLVSPLPSPRHHAAPCARKAQGLLLSSTSAASLSPCPSQLSTPMASRGAASPVQTPGCVVASRSPTRGSLGGSVTGAAAAAAAASAPRTPSCRVRPVPTPPLPPAARGAPQAATEQHGHPPGGAAGAAPG